MACRRHGWLAKRQLSVIFDQAEPIMKLLLAADGSPFTQKALVFLAKHRELLSGADELVVLNVQPPVPGRVTTMLGSADVAAYHLEESAAVLDPARQWLDQQKQPYRCESVVGHAVEEILAAAVRENVDMVVMGTHGHGWLGRALMGSIAQRVVAESDRPVLLVK